MRRIRLKKGISKNELCSRAGLNKGYVYRLENDLISPTFSTLEKVSIALEESLSDIIKLSETESVHSLYGDVVSARPVWGSAADSSQE